MIIKKMLLVRALVCFIGAVNFLQAQIEQPSLSSPSALDLNKINSSSVKPAIKFDALEQSLAKIEQQLADTAAQVQKLKAHVHEVKNTVQEQMKADAEEKEKLVLQLQDTQEAHARLQHQVADNEIAVCLDQELSACLASAIVEPITQDPVLVTAHSVPIELDGYSDDDEGVDDEYEEEL